MDARLHALSGRVFEEAVQGAESLGDALAAQSKRLVESDYHAQVRVAENFTLLFHYTKGRRQPLRLRDGRFARPDGESFTAGELLEQFRREPLSLSPNVLLRPVMQDALLPTVAYVGGPSELAYLAQAVPVYERILGRMPVIFPRASFTLLEPPIQRILQKYGLTLQDVCAGKQALREKMASRFLPPDVTTVFQKAAADLTRNLDEIQTSLAKLDLTLVEAAENSGRKMQYQLSTLERKAAQSVQSRTDQIERDAQRIENALYPQKNLQERFYSGINYLGRYGLSLVDDLYEQVSVECSDHQVAGVE
jgi:bacillithiol biosynthesis cysteine-adding enzyme BshC